MAKYTIMVDTYATASYVIEAESRDEAREKLDEIIQGDSFFEGYRKNCDFFEPTQSDVIEEE